MPPIIIALFVLAVEGGLLVGIAYFLRERLFSLLRASASAKGLMVAIDAVLGVAVGGFLSGWKLLSLDAWADQTPVAVGVAYGIWGILFWGLIVSKVTSFRATAREEDKINQLEKKLLASESQVTVLRRQRENLVRLTWTVREIVREKLERVWALAKKDVVTAEEFVEVVSVNRQIPVILGSLHQFFKKGLQPGESLRLGLYMREHPGSTQFVPKFAYNGHRDFSFTDKSRDHMKFDNPHGAHSEVVKLLGLTKEHLKIIEDCEAAEKGGDFTYLHPDQRNYLKSLVVYKEPLSRGKDDVVVFTLDCNRPGFFKESDRETIETAFSEMSSRLEYELLTTEVTAKIPKAEAL